MLKRFNATKLLERLRNKRLVFVGDSLNRGQWVSMVCLVDSIIPSSLKSMQSIANGSLNIFKIKVSFHPHNKLYKYKHAWSL
jgi:3,4-dihydroxy-2-butanone 4-phosphate synthase